MTQLPGSTHPAAPAPSPERVAHGLILEYGFPDYDGSGDGYPCRTETLLFETPALHATALAFAEQLVDRSHCTRLRVIDAPRRLLLNPDDDYTRIETVRARMAEVAPDFQFWLDEQAAQQDDLDPDEDDADDAHVQTG